MGNTPNYNLFYLEPGVDTANFLMQMNKDSKRLILNFMPYTPYLKME